MSKKILKHGDDEFSSEIMKRVVWLSAEKTKEEEATAETKPKDQEKIEKHLGIRNAKAIEAIGGKAEKYQDTFKGVFDKWDMNFAKRWGKWEKGNKKALEKAIHDQAVEEAKAFAEAQKEDGVDVSKHAKNSLHILGHEVNISEQLVEELGVEIKSIEEQLGIMNKALDGLKWSERIGVTGIRGSLTEKRLKSLQSMQSTTEQIKAKKEEEMKSNIGEKHEKIGSWNEQIENILGHYLDGDESEKSQRIQDALYRLGYEGKKEGEEEGEGKIEGISDLLEEAGTKGIPSDLKKIVDCYITKLEKGEAAFFGMGGIKKEDITGYYLLNKAKVKYANQSEDISKRIDALKMPRQEVKLSNKKTYTILKKDNDGFLLKQRGGKMLAYINTRDKSNPVLTLQTKETKENGKKKIECEMYCMEAKKSSNKDSVEFEIEKKSEEASE